MTDTLRFLAGPAGAALQSLCERSHVRRLDLFGSAVGDRFDPTRSDLDFLVTFENLPRPRYADAYFALREGLARLFGREVDLLTEAGLANPFLRRRIESERRQIYPAT